ncbi:MAG: 1-deoxy-D-xylulose-5-phosphate synthase [Candidatus Omnitrophica bacterium]|nr:1-deoxy-D-xylulose-5-phosphate synthase [Candidatus Omnitrophota bacterium]MDD5236593.1 1-deoxy-D-xylulose-5-phosphate synthase [Candidatus Omnitrophota bacterium]MDD5610721.1 1-deoxy-D-xylulose-5-phosphate synthase [Candidatus Omnitrophota bacterium]
MLLDTINSPRDLKQLVPEQLPQLAAEVRARIIDVVSKTGGHLASSLGAVELTIALHYCLDTPQDKIIWDVGHQAYAHKILTGRNKQFDKLRQADGINAFCSKDESEHDVFTTGHSSSSVSLALGLVAGQKINPSEHPFKVVAVVGDGSLSGGLCFEGLNNAGHLGEDITIILNTNELSISPNAGAISTYLNKLISLPIYNRFRSSLENFMKNRVPKGSRILGLVNKFEEGLKGLFIPGMLFEELGFRYFGPFAGHNFEVLVPSFKNILSLKGPKIIHVVTQKGKGYLPAEKDPVKFHSTQAFELLTGEPKIKQAGPSYTSVFSNKLIGLAEADPKIVAITAAMPEGTGLHKFHERFPKRFFDVGIAEAHAVCFAAGLAKSGLKPVVAVYSTFLQRAYDQIIEEVALQDLPVVFILDRAGVVSADGPTHQGIFDLAYLRTVPDLVVMAPSCAEELEQMLAFALRENKPVAIRYPKDKAIFCASAPAEIKLGQPQIVREGKDALIFALGSMLVPALGAAEALASEGINITVANSRFVKPLDKNYFLKIAETMPAIFTIEDGIRDAGFGSAVEEILDRPVQRLGLPDAFIPTGSREAILEKYALDASGISRTIKKALKEKTYAQNTY